jgi:hypothetical protein
MWSGPWQLRSALGRTIWRGRKAHFWVRSELAVPHAAQIGARALEEAHAEHAVAVTRILGDVLSKLEAPFPDDIDTTLPARKEVDLDLSELRLDIECANLPLQDAVDLVSSLVNLQSGRSKFVRGVATVGGRTRIGVITKSADLRMINEPEIIHRNIGFGFDFWRATGWLAASKAAWREARRRA